MKKSSIVMLVVAIILVLSGVGLMASGTICTQTVTSYGGFTFRYYHNFVNASQIARIVIGGFLFLGGVIFFATLSILAQLHPCHSKEKECMKEQPQAESPKIAVKVEEENKTAVEPREKA